MKLVKNIFSMAIQTQGKLFSFSEDLILNYKIFDFIMSLDQGFPFS